MKITFAMPTHRHSAYAIARCADLLAFAEEVRSDPVLANSIEIILSDNSGNDSKRALLRPLLEGRVRHLEHESCGPYEHFDRILEQVRGQYLMFLADDDRIYVPGLVTLARRVCQAESSPMAAFAGGYLIDGPTGIGYHAMQGLDAVTATARLGGWLSRPGPNVLYYAPIRIDIFRRYQQFCRSHPALMSFHDQLLTLMVLQSGAVDLSSPVFYHYAMGNWADAASARATDARFLAAAGIDPSMESILWIIGALEGAFMALSPTFSYLDADEAERFASVWFQYKFREARIDGRVPQGGDPAAIRRVERFRAKWLGQDDADLIVLFGDLVDLFRDLGFARADAYFDFWNDSLGGLLAEPVSAAA